MPIQRVLNNGRVALESFTKDIECGAIKQQEDIV